MPNHDNAHLPETPAIANYTADNIRKFATPDEQPYVLYSNEASAIIDQLLVPRLGKYSQLNANYFAAPAGSRHPGFQQEYPYSVSEGTDGILVLSVVLKGLVAYSGIPVWMNTSVGVAAKSRHGIELSETLAIVTPGYGTGPHDYNGDIFDERGRINPDRATRTVYLLRRALKRFQS